MISVIIPTFNRSKEISRAIESVVNQTLKDWELIIIDDGSKDDTLAVVEKYKETHKNIHYFYYENMGASVARNAGIRLSKGELIAFLDSDDIWTKNRLLSVYEVYLKEKGSDKFYLTDFRSHIVDDSLFNRKFLVHPHFQQMLLASNFLGGTINMIIPRRILSELGGFDTGLTSSEDHDLYIRLVEQYEITYVPGEFAIYYLDTSNRISRKNKNRLLGQLKYYKKHRKKMSILSRLMVMKKNAIIAFNVKSPVLLRYFHAWFLIWLMKKIYRTGDDMNLFSLNSWVLNLMKKNNFEVQKDFLKVDVYMERKKI